MSKVTFEVDIMDLPSDGFASDSIINTIAGAIKNVSFPSSEKTKITNVTVTKFVKTDEDFDIKTDLKEIGSFIVEEVDYAVSQWGYDIGNKFGIDECVDWKRITGTMEKLSLDDIIIVFTYVKECTDDWQMIIPYLAEHLVEHFDTDEAEKELYGAIQELEEEEV